MDELWSPAEAWSAAVRRTWQDQRLREIVAAAWPHAPALREALEGAGASAAEISLDLLPRLPVLRKDALPALQRQRPPFGGWLGTPLAALGRIYRSPGPILDPEGREEDYWRFAPALFAAGFRAGEVVLNTLAYQLTPAGLMFDGALRVLGCPVVPAGPGNTETQVSLLAQVGITGYIGTPSFLATLLDAAATAGRPVTLRRAFVIAEMLPEALRQQVQATHGVEVSQGYGTADVGSVAYECSRRQGMHIWHELIVELLDPQTGQPVPAGAPGEVVVTALNPVYPLLRLATGDLAVMAEGACPCGRTAPRIGRILGRVGDAVKVRGMFVHPAEIDLIMARHPEVARYQVAVSRTGHQDEMRLRIELRPGAVATDGLTQRLRQAIHEGVRLRCEIDLVPPGALPADARKIVDERRWE
ncbi:MAG: AMP-binding protein [Armatimonadota bacterium]|nr:AMP-binding protein [Armatimonadota bacterium]MDR7532805.1 AMP-binding protein [Armatimonadota bacterium]MDR7535191.1 AMP-binding protein [Armatimonadota bacterium]